MGNKRSESFSSSSDETSSDFFYLATATCFFFSFSLSPPQPLPFLCWTKQKFSFYRMFEILTPLPSLNPITESRALLTSGSSSPRASRAAASLCDGTDQTLTVAPPPPPLLLPLPTPEEEEEEAEAAEEEEPSCSAMAWATSCCQLPTWTSTLIARGTRGGAGELDAAPLSSSPPSPAAAAAVDDVARETDATALSLSLRIHRSLSAGLIDDAVRST